jgi:protein-tyrosine phosphatase
VADLPYGRGLCIGATRVSRREGRRYDGRVRHSGVSPAKRLLFVCTGNICRSPLAEAIFRHQVEQAGRASDFELDSAGTHGYHEGERADARARAVGAARGVAVTSIAREVRDSDFKRFDLILAMDRGHLHELRGRCPVPLRDKIRLMREFGEPTGGDVPDPYYSDDGAFEVVFDILDGCCRGLLAELTR